MWTGMAALFNGGVMTGSFVEGLFKQFGGVSVVRAVPVEPETGADGDWKVRPTACSGTAVRVADQLLNTVQSTNNSWAVVSFVSPSTVKDVMAKKKKSGGYLRFRALDNCDIDVVPLRMDYINGNVGLEQIAGDAEVELLVSKNGHRLRVIALPFRKCLLLPLNCALVALNYLHRPACCCSEQEGRHAAGGGDVVGGASVGPPPREFHPGQLVLHLPERLASPRLPAGHPVLSDRHVLVPSGLHVSHVQAWEH